MVYQISMYLKFNNLKRCIVHHLFACEQMVYGYDTAHSVILGDGEESAN